MYLALNADDRRDGVDVRKKVREGFECVWGVVIGIGRAIGSYTTLGRPLWRPLACRGTHGRQWLQDVAR